MLAAFQHADGARQGPEVFGQVKNPQLRAVLPVRTVDQRQQRHADLLAHQFHQRLDGVEFQEFIQRHPQAPHEPVYLQAGALGAVKAQERVLRQHLARVRPGRRARRDHHQLLFI
ncbi:hypothetical protein D3C77_683520 [compost metagenome]